MADTLPLTEVAGNGEIVVSVLAPWSFTYDLDQRKALFSADVLTQPQLERVVLQAPVQSLHTLLATLVRRGLEVEHIYDY